MDESDGDSSDKFDSASLQREDKSAKDLQRFRNLVDGSNHVVVLTGAGISTNAGIPDFRGATGLYQTGAYDPEKVFDIRCFLRDPEPFYEFAIDFMVLLREAKPTPTHRWLRKMEDRGKLDAVITQNIDCLHKRAGSRRVIELHGSFEKSYCMMCKKEYSLEDLEEILPGRCSCGGLIKPDIVFYGEQVKNLESAVSLSKSSDLFLVIGSSLAVYPASYLPMLGRGEVVIINRGRTFYPESAWHIDEDADIFFLSLNARGL